MRCMVLLLLLCLVGVAAADAVAQAQYSRNQLMFLNGPDEGSFQQNVQNYWNAYVDGGIGSTATSNAMGIWLNTFPSRFENPIKLGDTTFTAGMVSVRNVSPSVLTSNMLEREIVYKFSQSKSPAAVSEAVLTSFSAASSGSTSSQESQGQIITQSIITLFGM